MSTRTNPNKARQATATVATLALGAALLQSSFGGSHPKPPKAETVTMSVEDFKRQLEGMGITMKSVPVTPGATAIDLIKQNNIDNGLEATNAEGQHTTTSVVHLGDFALERLAQVTAGEGTGQVSDIGPDGVEEHDLIYVPAGRGVTPNIVDVPIITSQETANRLAQSGPLPTVE